MKLHLFSLALISAVSVCDAVSVAGKELDSPHAGDMVIDAGIGVGMLDAGESKAMFTQRVGAEWVILPKLGNDNLSLSAGIYLNNAYCSIGEIKMVGTYDYTYNIRIDSKVTGISYNEVRRTGYGTALATLKRNDLNIIPTISLRYRFSSCLDAYISIGAGLGIMHAMTGDMSDFSGFDQESYSHTDKKTGRTTSYSFNDLNHVEWGETTDTKATAALAAYVGVRYALTPNWGINGQFGLISGNIKESAGNSYNLFSVGASYKF